MDIQHYYIEKGNGEPLILLHGNGEDCRYFCHQIDFFSKWYHVYALDTRGHGKTPRGACPFTIRQFAEDLNVFMQLHDIPKASILGFSDGGNIAMIFALRYPEKVNKLILNGANLNARGVKRSVQLPIEIGYRFASLFADRDKKAKAKAELLGLMVNDPNISYEELQRIKQPTLVMAGTRDMICQEHTMRIAQTLPNAQLVLIKGDHFIANKEPKKFNEAVWSFLDTP